MKKVMAIALKQIGKLADCTLSMSANSTSHWMLHQPKVPESVEKFKKK